MLQEHGPAAAPHHGPPYSIFTGIWKAVKETDLGRWFRFNEENRHLGMFWFDAILFSLMASVLLIVLATLATKNYGKVPRGLQNVFEWAVGLLRGLSWTAGKAAFGLSAGVATTV